MNSGFVPVKREVLEQLQSTLGAIQAAYMHDKEAPPEYLNESIREVSAALKQPGVESAVEVLRLLEWTEIHHDYRPSEFYCPICDRDRRSGHEADCILAKALAAPQPAHQEVDWTQVGKLIDVAFDQRVRQHITGTSNWAEAVCRLMAEETRPVKKEERP